MSLYAKEGQDKLAVLLPGRHSCECLAQKHTLINNCISCGRIVCEQEGSGPCLFCGSLVWNIYTPYFSLILWFLIWHHMALIPKVLFWLRSAQKRSKRSYRETRTKARSWERNSWEVRIKRQKLNKTNARIRWIWNCSKIMNFLLLLKDFGERDILPHQEAKIKAGLEKAVQHKEKLLEYDKNR